MTALLTATTAAPFTEKVTVPLVIALLGLTGVIITALAGLIGGRWAQAT